MEYLKGKDTKTSCWQVTEVEDEEEEQEEEQEKPKTKKPTKKRKNESKNTKNKKSKTEPKIAIVFKPPEGTICECGLDSSTQEHSCIECKRKLHAFCGVKIGEQEGHGSKQKCMYCINKGLPPEISKPIFSIVQTLSEKTKKFDNFQNFKPFFDKSNDKLAKKHGMLSNKFMKQKQRIINRRIY